MPPFLTAHLPVLRRAANFAATAVLAVLLLWSVGLIICQPLCAAPILPVAGLIYWHWKFKGKLSLRKWLWVYVIAQVAIFLCLPGPQNVAWEPLGAKAPHFFSEYDDLRIDHIRDFRYRTAEDYDILYREESIRLTDIVAVSFAESRPKADSAVSRPMLSFELRNGHHLVIAPEVRHPQGAANPLLAWYKGCGLLYVFGTEEDVFLRSTDILHEQLRVYPLNITPQQAMQLFRRCMALSRRSVSAREVHHPLWDRYASGIARALQPLCPSIPKMVPFDCAHLARHLYTAGLLQTAAHEDFATLQTRCTVGHDVMPQDNSTGYSDELRRRIGAPFHQILPQEFDAEGDDSEEEDEYRPQSTGLIFSGNRFMEDIPEPNERGGVPYHRSDAAGRAAAIPEPGARLQADALPTRKNKKKRRRN